MMEVYSSVQPQAQPELDCFFDDEGRLLADHCNALGQNFLMVYFYNSERPDQDVVGAYMDTSTLDINERCQEFGLTVLDIALLNPETPLELIEMLHLKGACFNNVGLEQETAIHQIFVNEIDQVEFKAKLKLLLEKIDFSRTDTDYLRRKIKADLIRDVFCGPDKLALLSLRHNRHEIESNFKNLPASLFKHIAIRYL